MDSSAAWQPSVPAFFSHSVQGVKDFFDSCVEDTAAYYMPCGGVGHMVGYRDKQRKQIHKNVSGFISLIGVVILNDLDALFASQASSLSGRSILKNPKITYGLMGAFSPGALILKLSLNGLQCAFGAAQKEHYVYAVAKLAMSMMGLYSFHKIQEMEYSFEVLGVKGTVTSLSNYIIKTMKISKALDFKLHDYALVIESKYIYWPKHFFGLTEENIKKISGQIHRFSSLKKMRCDFSSEINPSGCGLTEGQKIILVNEKIQSQYNGYQRCLFDTGKHFPNSRDRLGYDTAHQFSHSQYVRLVCNEKNEVLHFERLSDDEDSLILIKTLISDTYSI